MGLPDMDFNKDQNLDAEADYIKFLKTIPAGEHKQWTIFRYVLERRLDAQQKIWAYDIEMQERLARYTKEFFLNTDRTKNVRRPIKVATRGMKFRMWMEQLFPSLFIKQ